MLVFYFISEASYQIKPICRHWPNYNKLTKTLTHSFFVFADFVFALFKLLAHQIGRRVLRGWMWNWKERLFECKSINNLCTNVSMKFASNRTNLIWKNNFVTCLTSCFHVKWRSQSTLSASSSHSAGKPCFKYLIRTALTPLLIIGLRLNPPPIHFYFSTYWRLVLFCFLSSGGKNRFVFGDFRTGQSFTKECESILLFFSIGPHIMSEQNAAEEATKWICNVCTFENWPKSIRCTMCRSNNSSLIEVKFSRFSILKFFCITHFELTTTFHLHIWSFIASNTFRRDRRRRRRTKQMDLFDVYLLKLA